MAPLHNCLDDQVFEKISVVKSVSPLQFGTRLSRYMMMSPTVTIGEIDDTSSTNE